MIHDILINTYNADAGARKHAEAQLAHFMEQRGAYFEMLSCDFYSFVKQISTAGDIKSVSILDFKLQIFQTLRPLKRRGHQQRPLQFFINLIKYLDILRIEFLDAC